MYAGVVVDTGASSSIDTLTYEVPDGLAAQIGIGTCVLVPLGSSQAVGYVVGLKQKSDFEKTKKIIAVIETPVSLNEELYKLARWISSQYMCSFARTVLGMLPGVMHRKIKSVIELCPESESPQLTPSEDILYNKICSSEEFVTLDDLYKDDDKARVQRLIRSLETKNVIKRSYKLLRTSAKPKLLRGVEIIEDLDDLPKLTDKQQQVLDVIKALGGSAIVTELTQKHLVSASSISSLVKKGIITPINIAFRRAPEFSNITQHKITLMDEQKAAVDEINAAIDTNIYKPFLLHGVTASGKTEIYLRCIEHALIQGKSSLVLLPEIALTTQVMNIFKSRFGDLVAVLHSGLSTGERYDEWIRVQEGEARIIVGARSAVFAPIQNLGLVVVDEEHESSYKQDTTPRYHGKEVALKRAEFVNAVMVLGSATPSIESFYKANKDEYKLITLACRVANRPMPKVFIADSREEYAKGKATIFSSMLEEKIIDRLEKHEQIILLQNRRAYSTFLLCRDCGYVHECPNCAVALKFHSAARKMSCHHCDYILDAPDVCPKCEGRRIGKFGIGTERVEEETRKCFPDARILRMDRDTTSAKGAHRTILSAFRNQEADILIGTQMIAKGLDFPNVTLVGVISADTSLNLPDFRASERTFQLISQVAGRSGRGTELGEVIVQTFDPDNYAIECAVTHDYHSFYNQEIESRKEVNYPPYGAIISMMSVNENEKMASGILEEFVDAFKSKPMSLRMGIEVIGPQPAVLSKLRGEYRWHVLFRSKNKDRLHSLVSDTLKDCPKLRKNVIVDVDPVSMI